VPNFAYTALDGSGQRVAGVIAGASEQAVLAELETRKLTPVQIDPAPEPRRVTRRISSRKLAASYTQLADLLRAGVPILRGLRLLGNRRSTPALSSVFKSLADTVAEGEDLASAMGRHTDVFPPVHIAMVKAGEKGGFLEGVLARLGDLVQAQADMRGKVIGNLIYPAALVLFGTLVTGVIFWFFVPMFRPMFSKVPGGVPSITQLVFFISDAISRFGLITLIVLGALVFTGFQLSARPAVKARIERWRTMAPVLGPLVRALAAARFCRMLGTMLANGVPLLAAMQISRQAAGNGLMETAIDRAMEAVRAGQHLAPPLAESKLFDDDVIEMISVGESANNLDDVLMTIAVTIETRIDRLLSGVVRLIEPLLLMLIAGVVVLVAVALLLPMTRLSGNL